jgi:Rap1a immunity proteins
MTSSRSNAIAAALAVALSMPGEARSATPTNEMMEWCKPLADDQIPPNSSAPVMNLTFESGTCYGAFLALQALAYNKLLGVCAPNGVGVVQIVRLFDAYARQHPEVQHQSFEFTALAAMRLAFPCNRDR